MLIENVEFLLSKFLEKSETIMKETFIDVNSIEDLSLSKRLELCLNDRDDSYINKMKYEKRKNFNYYDFNDKFKKTILQPYIVLLVEYHNQYISAQEAKKYIAELLYKNYRDEHLDEIKYTELLLFIQEKLGKSYGIDITFKNSSLKKLEIRDGEYLKYIYDATKQFYLDKGFNNLYLTHEEALETLRQPIFVEDLKDAYEQCGLDPSLVDIDNIPAQVVDYYSKSVYTKKEVDKNFLTAKKNDLENRLKVFEETINPGRKFINQQVSRFALNLSYLIRLKRFIEQDEVNDIFDMKVKNEDLKLIYEYVLFWGMKNKEDIGSGYTNVDNWIKTYKKLNPEARNNVNVLRINQLRATIRK
jgi:hypothetical protein